MIGFIFSLFAALLKIPILLTVWLLQVALYLSKTLLVILTRSAVVSFNLLIWILSHGLQLGIALTRTVFRVGVLILRQGLYYGVTAITWLSRVFMYTFTYVLQYGAFLIKTLLMFVSKVGLGIIKSLNFIYPVAARTLSEGVRLGLSASVGAIAGGFITGTILGFPGFVIGAFLGVVAGDLVTLLLGGDIKLGLSIATVKGVFAGLGAGIGYVFAGPLGFFLSTGVFTIAADLIGRRASGQETSLA